MQNTATMNSNKFQYMGKSAIVRYASKGLMQKDELAPASAILKKRIPGCTLEFIQKELHPIYSEPQTYFGILVTLNNQVVGPRIGISDHLK